MAILDNEQVTRESEQDSFLYRIPEVTLDTEFLDLSNAAGFRDDIIDTSEILKSTNSSLIKPIMEKNLEERMQEFAEVIAGSDLVVVSYPGIYEARFSSFVLLGEAFTQIVERDDSVTTQIPGGAIQGYDTTLGQHNIGAPNPALWLKLKTGLEPPVKVFKKGEVSDDNSQGRWYQFFLFNTQFRALTRVLGT